MNSTLQRIVILSGALRGIIAKCVVEGPAVSSRNHLRPVGPGNNRCTVLFALLLLAAPARAHVGNKDVFEQVSAGPYNLFVTIRTPTVIPGIATVEVRAASNTPSDTAARVTSIRITPIPLTGEAAKHPPTSDPMLVSPDDPAFFTGSLWLMASGSWQVRLEVEGPAGPAVAGVPVAAAALSLLPMQRPLAVLLAALGTLLVLGMVGIVAAAVREARLAPGLTPTPERRRRAAMAGVVTLLLLVFALYAGDRWWKVEAAAYAADIYHPSDLRVTLTGNHLDLMVGDYDVKRRQWRPADSNDELLVDHGHLMHLYAIRWPQMDAAFHLHPTPVGEKHLALTLPTMPPGDYRLYADIVRLNGFPETLTATLTVPLGLPPTPLGPDDASVLPPPLAGGDLGPSCKLPDGYTMLWDRPDTIVANTAYTLRFHLLDRAGNPATDVQPYLGMAGHAAFVKEDGTAFAHTHPDGSAAMPAMLLANPASANGMASTAMPGKGGMDDMSAMADMTQPAATSLSPTVEFPYGFPSPGRYRIFIQMKHATTIETGVFDADVQ